MYEVLIPVDFSEESLVALDYGVDLANHLKSNLRVIHVKTESFITPFFAADNVEYKLNQNVDKWAEELYDRFKGRYTVKNGVFDYKIRVGDIVKEITNQAKYGDSTIIVLGSHEDTSISAKWVGSSAYRLVSHSPCPVLVVNKRMKLNHELKNIAVPVDYSVASRKKVAAVAGMAHLFEANVTVVGLKESDLKWMNAEMKVFERQVSDYISSKAKVDVHTIELTGRDTANALMDYCNTNNIDLLTAHVHHTTNPFVRVFQSFTNELINKSLKPVLVIPTKD